MPSNARHPLSCWSESDAVSKSVLAIALLSVLFVFLPTLQFDYVAGDQWRAFRYSTDSGANLERLAHCLAITPERFVQTGRPLVWVTECIEHSLVNTIRDYWVLRFFSLGVVVFTVLYLGCFFSKFLSGIVPGVVASSMFVMMPGYVFMLYEGLTSLMVLISIILSVRSFEIIAASSSPFSKCNSILWAATFFLLSCLIYPSFAFVTIPLIFFRYLHDRTIKFNNRCWRLWGALVFYFFISIIYFFLVKLLTAIMRGAVEIPELDTDHQFEIEIDPIVLAYRAQYAIEYFWEIMPLWTSDIFWHLFICSCGICVIFFIFKVKKMNMRHIATGLLSVTGMLCCFMVFAFASIAPWLFSQSEMVYVIYLLPWQMSICLTIVACCNSVFLRVVKSKYMNAILLVIVLLIYAQESHGNVYSFCSRGSIEIEKFRNQLSEWVEDESRDSKRYLLFISPPSSYACSQNLNVKLQPFESKKTQFVNYGYICDQLPSRRWRIEDIERVHLTNLFWGARAIFRELFLAIPFEISVCLRDNMCIVENIRHKDRVVIDLGYEAEIERPLKAYVVNLTKHTSDPIFPRLIVKEMPTLVASSTLNSLGVSGLFYAVQPGWHARKDPTYPQYIDIDMKENVQMFGFEFLPQDRHKERMPRRLVVEVSADGFSWVEAVKVDNLCDGPYYNGWRRLYMPAPINARWIKISILSNCGSQEYLSLRGFRILRE